MKTISMSALSAWWSDRWKPIDVAVALYTLGTALLVVLRHEVIPQAASLLAFHASVLAFMAILPPRGSSWERAAPAEAEAKRHVRGGVKFLRYTYPLVLVIFFFEEVEYTVNALTPSSPYWFEAHLYAADRWLFGGLPARLLASWDSLVLNEIFHAFYFSYYFILISGVVVAWLAPGRGPRERPAPGFDTAMTSTILSFLFCFVWYPWLPARGPWENPALMAELPRFEGGLFTGLVEWIIARGAVSGGCFPSSHVAASWGLVLGLAAFHRKAVVVLGVLTVGLSVSCVYTRYHHGVDVPAGLAMGVLGAWVGRWLTGERPPAAASLRAEAKRPNEE